MERTSFKSPLWRSCEKCGRLLCFASALALLGTGCAEYYRIKTPDVGKTPPLPPSGPRFLVVDFTLEQPGLEEKAERVRKLKEMQAPFEAALPDRFSTEAESIPVVVKIRVEDDGYGSWFQGFTILLGIPTLGLVPVMVDHPKSLEVMLQLGPGQWSDCEKSQVVWQSRFFNLLYAPFAPLLLSSKEGWQKEPQLITFFKEGGGAHGENEAFMKYLAQEILRTWEGLSPGDRQRVRRNPVAAKLKAELYPETEAPTPSSNTGVAVPKAPAGNPAPAEAAPSVAGYGFVESSRRGFVEVAKNGTEHLAALKWAREEIIPKIAGEGASIRILSEKTLENGNSRIDFEVLR